MKTNNQLDRRSFLGCFAGAAATIVLAGCGSTGGSSSSTSADSTASASASDEESYTLIQDGKLIVASDIANPPFDYMEDGEAKGFEVDLLGMIATKLGLTCEYLPQMKFETLIPLIKAGGKADVGVSNFTITDERKKEIDFTDPYIDSNQGIVVKTGAEKTTIEALNAEGVQVTCQTATTGEAWARENLPKATIVPLDDPVTSVTGVSTGLYDACAADLPVMQYLCNNSFKDCEVAVEIPTGEQYAIVVSKDNPGLTKAMNKALSELQADGSLDELEIKWFGTTI